mmetsp:Transcript_7976/g.16739  ORF Transcript_7976/g.16739 Transcript_7976/m.16739 type:complete len:255 (+) Transcript_7976:832-1596(+)
MRVEIEACAVGNAYALQPAVASLDLGIPAVLGVVRHLRWEVLAEATSLRLNPDAHQEEEGTHDEVPESLVVHDTTSDRIPDGHLHMRLSRQLLGGGEELKLRAANALELRMLLRSRFHEKLDLGLRELPLPSEPCTWRDLVPKRLPNLSDSQGQFVGVLLEAILVVQEDALRCLRPQEALDHARRADGRREHEVEGLGLCESVAAIGRSHVVSLEDLGELLLRVRVGLVPTNRVLRLFLFREALLLELLVHDVL